ncbi:MAG: HepT-like ribonuclease domain-containing protein [Candidatus Thorarchaeota archaeon]
MSNEIRRKRYMQKINHGRMRISLLNQKLQSGSDFNDTETLLIIQKAYQEVVEVSTDILAMMLKDNELPPMDNYSNVKMAKDNHIISPESADVLREANGLRNRIVHIYNDLDIDLLIRSVKRTLPQMEKYIEEVETWMSQTFHK